MTNPPAAVALVGHRKAARRAARTAQLSFDIVDPEDPLPHVDDLRARLAPGAVVATTESSVIAAARLREALKLPGNTLATAERCVDKLLMKRAVHAAGLPCARFSAVDGQVDGNALIAELGLPMMLKARIGSGGRDARIVRVPEHLPAAVSKPHIAESFVRGVEMSVESFVVAGEPVFVNLTEYVEPRWVNLVPARVSAPTQAALLGLNRRAIRALGIERGMTHMEVFLTDDGPVFGELGARPPGGHIMRLIELAWGFNPWRTLLEVELGRKLPAAGHAPQGVETGPGWAPVLPAAPRQFAGARFIHPRPGVLRVIHGLDALESLPALNELYCKLKPGATIAPRNGTGQHHGYVILAGNESEVRHGLDTVRDSLRFEMESQRLSVPQLR